MKRYEPQSVGDLLRQAVEESLSTPKFDELNAIHAWPRVIGVEIARRAGRPYMKNGRMTISVPSAPLRQELNMMRSQIAAAINAEVGKPTVTDLRFY